MTNLRKTSLPLTMLLSVSVALCNNPFPTTQSCSYDEIGNMFTHCFGLEKPLTAEEQEAQEKKKEIEISASEKRSLPFTLLSKNEERNNEKRESNPLLKTALEDLEFFYAPGREYNDTLFAQLNHTQSAFGRTVLAKILSTPQIDTNILQGRQNLIQELINNPALFNQLEKMIEEIKNGEDNILSFWKNEPQLARKAIASKYFRKSKLKFSGDK